jgi:purine-binding chemotaxis protein CheW
VSDTYVRVRVAGEQYALPVEHVAEVVELGAVTPVPGASPLVLGLYNLRGEIVSVIDLASVLALTGDGHPTRLLLATDGDRRAGLAIGEVLDVGPLHESSPEHDVACVTATAVIDGELLGLLDVGALLDAVAGAPA